MLLGTSSDEVRRPIQENAEIYKQKQIRIMLFG
jgi:hypothetical protein